MAMAHQRLGHTAEARQWLDKAINWIDSSPRDKPKDDTLGTRIDWRTWLALQVLRREAEALIKGSKPDAPARPALMGHRRGGRPGQLGLRSRATFE